MMVVFSEFAADGGMTMAIVAPLSKSGENDAKGAAAILDARFVMQCGGAKTKG